MFYFSIILSVILGIIVIINLYLLTRDRLWNSRLKQYQESTGMEVTVKERPQRFERTLSATLSLILMVVITPMIFLKQPTTTIVSEEVVKRNVEANTVSSAYQLDELFKSSSIYREEDTNAPTDGITIGTEKDKTIDTNEQVKGVKEADIIKTSGKYIYYAPRNSGEHMSTLYMIQVDNGVASLYRQVHFDDFYIMEFFLTESYVVLIGHQSQPAPSNTLVGPDVAYMNYTGAIRILDVNTLKEVYSLNTKGYIMTYRLIDNVLYLFQQTYRLEGNDPRMTFDVRQGHITYQRQVEVSDILFFNIAQYYALNYITSINLTNFNIQSKAFLGNVHHVYVSKGSAYIAMREQNEYNFDEALQRFEGKFKTRIVKYSLSKDGDISYRASTVVSGMVINPYAMDEYDGMFRVVTTVFNHNDNRLYIFKESSETDEFIKIGYLTEGLGKEGETVKSVRFNEDKVNIVTFLQTDPNYTIDLKDPTNPIIIGAIIEPGFSVYMHPWGENRLMGLGFDANSDGRVTGIKLSAYSSLEESPLQTYIFDQEKTYYYSEALYDPRMIMVDPALGLFAFRVNSYSGLTYVEYKYTSDYYVFKIDFDQKPIIKEPFIIGSDAYSTNAIERAVYINGIIYTLSYGELKAVRVSDFEIIQTLNLIA